MSVICFMSEDRDVLSGLCGAEFGNGSRDSLKYTLMHSQRPDGDDESVASLHEFINEGKPFNNVYYNPNMPFESNIKVYA